MQRSFATDALSSERRRRRRRCCSCYWCRGDGYSDVYCSQRRLCVLVVVAVFVALLLLSVGFVAGWYARQMQHQQSPVSPAAQGIGITGKFNFPRLPYQHRVSQSSYASRFAILPASSKFDDCLADASR